MPISPEEITADNLPTAVRGYQKEATENLLKLVAWDYRRVLRERAGDDEETKRQRAHIDQLETELQTLRALLDTAGAQAALSTEPDGAAAELRVEVERLKAEDARLRGEVGDLRAELEKAEAEKAPLRAEIDRLVAEVGRLEAAGAAQRRREQLPEILLTTALRSARELREQARTECDQIVKAGRRRAQQIEREAHASVKRSGSEVERLHRMEQDLRDQLRRMLQAVMEGSETSAGNGKAAGSPRGTADDTLPAPPPTGS